MCAVLASLDRRHFDGCVPTIQQTLQLINCDFPRIQHPKTVANVPEETLESTTWTLPHVGVQHIQIQIGQFACTFKNSGQAPCDFEKRTTVLRELCRQNKLQQPHKKLDQVWFKGVETSDGSLDNVKKTKTTNTGPDSDAGIERLNAESEHDVVLL